MDKLERAKLYLSKCPAAISGEDGHKTAFSVIAAIVRGFDLDESEALEALAEWNNRCDPEWPEKDLLHKIRDARTKGRAPELGEFLRRECKVLSPAQVAERQQLAETFDAIKAVYRDAREAYWEQWDRDDLARRVLADEVLAKRGWSREFIDQQQIGFAHPDFDLWSFLREKGHKKDVLDASSLFYYRGERQHGSLDGRIVYWYEDGGEPIYAIGGVTECCQPWTDKDGKTVQPPKYKKLSETSVVKNPPCWGLDTARGSHDLIVVGEGIADGLTLAYLGLPVISPVTTRFAEDAKPLLARYGRGWKRILLTPDQETNGSGLKGAMDTAIEAAKLGLDCRIATIPGVEQLREAGDWKIDACEWIRGLLQTHSVEDVRQQVESWLEAAPPLLDYLVSEIPRSARIAEIAKMLAPAVELLAARGGEELEIIDLAAAVNAHTGVAKRSLETSLRKAVKAAMSKPKVAAVVSDDGQEGFARGDHVEVARRLVSELGEASVFADGAVYRYSDDLGTWEPLEQAALHRQIADYAGAPIGDKKVLTLTNSGIKGIREHAEDILAQPTFFRDGRSGFAFADCFVRIEDDGSIVTEPHSPENRAMFRYDFAWDLDAPADRFVTFLKEVFRDDADIRERVQFLLEYFGASLVGEAWRGEVATLWHGEGNDGKSSLALILREVFPPGSVVRCLTPRLEQRSGSGAAGR